MKKIGVILGAALSIMLLTGCAKLSSATSTVKNAAKSSSSSSGYQVTGKAADSEYQGVIENGKYLTSKARGVGISQNSDNLLNLKSFESGLTQISKTKYSTSDYIFREGQLLSSTTVKDWLGRKSKSNSTGLNPVDNGQTDANKRNPIYIQQIEEQDYMKEVDGKLKLAGITIGIGMNTKDYYQKEEYGATYTTSISKEKMIAEGKQAAAKVLERLRKTSGVSENTPIIIAMFQQATNDSLVGGSFYQYTYVKSGSTINDWTNLNYKSYVFPETSVSSVPNDNDETSFESFKKQVQNFFPNLAGVTAQAEYKNKTLQGMNVNITTQFYSLTEITSFTQYLAQAAKTYLPSGIPIDITVKGTDGTVQSFLARKADESSFYTHVFGSY
ncbi:CamS family sex pheromone protein [Liquorilactobacillus mali]|uniref:Lipoprotein, pheromone n=1 Tax=Liquorilactobacillus mali KCTC 3596 = DSM 20444 TaxID=1046596 RepID=J1F416_9LACO|nr:CamS family sex pheromone protein [Liquorilactobacillus mali]EJF00541.1 lipoprotein, pheromone precursor [Liquorilactobacillus mali KCTC 3596 = DSM 20444]KRN09706.1 lipoprotein, pheromone precursor [Liquorilactobacillus mali KCTC 3596 = DSM 20444]MDC7952993.1 CamS family sex pheromone protein [Liquorilactobacillus mali]QFQ73997.1 CamS family sex pheromone protein [Liquorilactobacillus mali]